MNTVSERLSLIQNELNITKIKLGELAGSKTPSQSITNWINRNSISKKAAIKLSENTGYSYLWIMDGTGNKKISDNNIQDSRLKAVEWESLSDLEKNDGEFITVPVLDIELSAGDGCHNQTENEMYKLPFRAYTLKKNGISIDQVKVVRVSGDSMEPKLSDEDTIAINMNDTRIRDGKIYAVRVFDSQKVKVLIKNSDGTITLRSLNSHYQDEIIPREQIESGEFQILGRMWWHSSIDI